MSNPMLNSVLIDSSHYWWTAWWVQVSQCCLHLTHQMGIDRSPPAPPPPNHKDIYAPFMLANRQPATKNTPTTFTPIKMHEKSFRASKQRRSTWDEHSKLSIDATPLLRFWSVEKHKSQVSHMLMHRQHKESPVEMSARVLQEFFFFNTFYTFTAN